MSVYEKTTIAIGVLSVLHVLWNILKWILEFMELGLERATEEYMDLSHF